MSMCGESWGGRDAAGSLVAGGGGEWSVVVGASVADVRLHGAVVSRSVRGERINLGSPAPVARRRQPDPSGRLTALRPAVADVAVPRPFRFEPELPDTGRAPSGFPLATVLTAAVTGAVAALFFSPIFAMLAGVSALAVVGRWVGSVLRRRRDLRRRGEAETRAGLEWNAAVASWSQATGNARKANRVDPQILVSMVEGEASAWWERLDAESVIEVDVGLGDVVVEVDAQPSAALDELITADQRTVTLADAPIVVRLDPGLAVCGDRADALRSARWVLASLLARIGPADLALVVVTTSDRVDDWDQVKWSPSLIGCVVVDVDRDDALAGCLERAGSTPVLVVVDGAEPTGVGLLARVLSGRVSGVSVVWVGDLNSIPAGCRSSLVVTAEGQGTLSRFDGGAPQHLESFGCSPERWVDVMRWLGRFDDPERPPDGEGLAPAVSLTDLVIPPSLGGEGDSAEAAGRRFADALQRRWSLASPQRLRAIIGADTEGPVEVDLVADGPHMLAAGTTGSGKSELLRTLVVGLANEQPPTLASFVLIDFKGGGAFDAVAALPHVAAVVTDLDPTEASRALRGLRAEILDREHRLREMEVSDVADVEPRHPRAFGRLVVIVDEFAALAEELPDFLDGLVDIARRGRSLGIHLVLATQRPSGVVTGQIRANTNLRLCLRVQDRGDSVDVIDDPIAGQLPPIPGRGVIRRGGGGCRQLQVAHVAGERSCPTVESFQIHPTADGAPADVISEIQHALGEIGGASLPMQSLVERMVQATHNAERATAPWRAPLVSASFPVAVDEPEACAIGLSDDPDRRMFRPMVWRPHADGLLVVGSDEVQIAATATTAVAAALDRDPTLPVFVIDGDRRQSADLARLGDLEPCIDIVGAVEGERALRAVERLDKTSDRFLVVIHNWLAVADALADHAGPLGVERLVKLVRRAGGPDAVVVVTARSDRDVPQRAAGSLGCRVIHRLADPAGYLSFGLRAADVGFLDGAACVDPTSGLVGVVATLDDAGLARLGARLDSGGRCTWPSPVRVLGDRVERAELPAPTSTNDGWRVPLGLDSELDPHWIPVTHQRPVVVLGHPGGGRTTAVTTISAALGDGVCVIDDADDIDGSAVSDLVAEAQGEGRPIVIGCTPLFAKRFGSPVADLLSGATTVLLNPSRSDGEVVRLPVPDLSDQPVGRAVAVDRGRMTIVQVAA